MQNILSPPTEGLFSSTITEYTEQKTTLTHDIQMHIHKHTVQ